MFVSISQVIGCEDRLRNDLYCVGWGVKLYSSQVKLYRRCDKIKHRKTRLMLERYELQCLPVELTADNGCPNQVISHTKKLWLCTKTDVKTWQFFGKFLLECVL